MRDVTIVIAKRAIFAAKDFLIAVFVGAVFLGIFGAALGTWNFWTVPVAPYGINAGAERNLMDQALAGFCSGAILGAILGGVAGLGVVAYALLIEPLCGLKCRDV